MSTKLSLKFVTALFEVQHDRRHNGYRVNVLLRAPMEDMYESLTHTALFVSQRDALELLRKMKAKGELDIAHWTWHVTRCSCWGFLAERSTAAVETTPRPISRALARMQEMAD